MTCRQLLLSAAALSLLAPKPSPAQVRGSERGTVSQVIDGTTISLDYSRPVARGRTPFGPGGVVHWGQRWTPGANWATTIETDRDIQVNGLPLPKGKYSLWMVPDQAEWQVILSRESRAFHTRPPGDSTTEVQFRVAPAQGSHMETLAWYFPVIAPAAATLRMHWGTTMIPLHIIVQPTRVVALSPEDRATYLGAYRIGPEPEGLPEPVIMEVFEVDGRLRGRATPGIFEHDAEFDLVPAGTGRFHPGWYQNGKLFDVETDMAFLFTIDGATASRLEFRGLAENLLFGRGERIR